MATVLSLDGVDDQAQDTGVSNASVESTDAFTVGFHLKPFVEASNDAWWGWHVYCHGGIEIAHPWMASGAGIEASVDIGFSRQFIQISGLNSAGNWIFVAYTRTAAGVELLRAWNAAGTLLASNTQTRTGQLNLWDTGAGLVLNRQDSGVYMRNYMANVGVHNAVLSDSQIATWRTTGVPPVTCSMGFWPLTNANDAHGGNGALTTTGTFVSDATTPWSASTGPAKKMKVWNGSAWTPSTAKVWNGSSWASATPKVWNGSAWI